MIETLICNVEGLFADRYHWSLPDIESMYLKDMFLHLSRIKQIKEKEGVEELVKAKLLAVLIHSDPNETIKSIDNLLEEEIYDEEIGDIQAIERLRVDKNRIGR